MPWAQGESASLCTDGAIGVVRMDPYRIDWRLPTGAWVRGTRIAFERIRVSEREKAAFLKRSGWAEPRGLEPAIAWPSEIPPVSTGVPICTRDGHLIVPRSLTADRPFPVFDVVDRRGVLVDRLMFPANHRLIGVGTAALYAAARDSLDVEKLVRYAYSQR
jgi:hypothetical protein